MRVLVGADGDDAVDLERLYAAPRRPWLRVNMVSTVDGAATGESGKSGSINNEPDHRVFDTLRGLCDVVVVGAGTARTEGYRDISRPLVLVSRRGQVPKPLRDVDPGAVRLATCATAEQLGPARDVLGEEHVWVLGEDEVDLGRLRSTLVDHGFEDLLCEGGPHLLGDLLAAGVVDELTSTVVPRVLSGDGPRIAAGPPVDVPLRLALLLEHESTLLARWLVGPVS